MSSKRVPPETDFKILADVALGKVYREISATYNVSPSYISKLVTGKKQVNVQLPPPPKVLVEDLETFEGDIDAIADFIISKRVLTSDKDIIKFLETQIHKAIVRAKIYTELLNTYKGEK